MTNPSVQLFKKYREKGRFLLHHPNQLTEKIPTSQAAIERSFPQNSAIELQKKILGFK
jgi:hypothetical protein